MLQLGLVQEVKSVLEQTSEDWPPLSSIGYKEVLRFLRGELPAESLETEIVQNTMRLAKRQKTWFRRDTEIHWFDPSQGFDGPLHELQVKLRL
jgi:tRNA dimethylallyltransferase